MNQVLSQDEINALLSGLSEGEIPGAEGPGSENAGGEDESQGDDYKGARKYDLASQERIIRGRMPTMELIYDRFTRSFRTALSKFLGKACFINVGSVEIVKFGLFMKKLPLPSGMHIYRMPPLQGQALLVMSTPLVFSMVDSLFGGSGAGKVKTEGREYTAIENRLIGKVVNMALENLKDAWAPIHATDFVYVRSEYNPLAVAIVPPGDVVVIVTIDIELENQSTSLTFCTPYSVIEPIRQKLCTGMQNSQLEIDTHSRKKMEWNIRKTETNLSVQLAKGKITPRAIMDLQVGDIIPLETSPSDEAVIFIEGKPKYRGYVGTYKGSKAVRVSGAIVPNEI